MDEKDFQEAPAITTPWSLRCSTPEEIRAGLTASGSPVSASLVAVPTMSIGNDHVAEG